MGLTISATSGTIDNAFNVRNPKTGEMEAQTFSASQFLEEVEDGEKPVAFLGYSEPFDLTSEQYGTSTMVRLLFQVGDGHDQAGGLFSTMFGMKLGPKARLREVVVAMLGRDLKPGEEVDLDDLIGSRLIVSTKSELNGKGTVITKYVSSRPAKKGAPKKDIWADEKY